MTRSVFLRRRVATLLALYFSVAAMTGLLSEAKADAYTWGGGTVAVLDGDHVAVRPAVARLSRAVRPGGGTDRVFDLSVLPGTGDGLTPAGKIVLGASDQAIPIMFEGVGAGRDAAARTGWLVGDQRGLWWYSVVAADGSSERTSVPLTDIGFASHVDALPVAQPDNGAASWAVVVGVWRRSANEVEYFLLSFDRGDPASVASVDAIGQPLEGFGVSSVVCEIEPPFVFARRTRKGVILDSIDFTQWAGGAALAAVTTAREGRRLKVIPRELVTTDRKGRLSWLFGDPVGVWFNRRRDATVDDLGKTVVEIELGETKLYCGFRDRVAGLGGLWVALGPSAVSGMTTLVPPDADRNVLVPYLVFRNQGEEEEIGFITMESSSSHRILFWPLRG